MNIISNSLSIVVVSYNDSEYLKSCLEPLLTADSASWIHEIVLVDNDSTHSLPDWIHGSSYESVRVIHIEKNNGYGAACNAAASQTCGEYILFLNSDVVVEPAALEELVCAFRCNENIAILGFQLWEENRCPAPSRFLFPKGPLSVLVNLIRHPNPRRELATAISLPVKGEGLLLADWVLGAAIGVRRTAFNQLGGFDEHFFLYFEEVDLCRRAKQCGWNVATVLSARAFHKHGASTSTLPPDVVQRIRHRSQVRYFRKHHGLLGWIAAKLDKSCLRWRL